MTDKELRKLKRSELLELLVEQSAEIDTLNVRIQRLESQLAQRKIELEKAGSIAEAAMALTDVFAQAQKAADIYLENVRRAAEEGRLRPLGENDLPIPAPQRKQQLTPEEMLRMMENELEPD